MTGDQRLGRAERLGEVADAQLPPGQQPDDPPAQRITEHAGEPATTDERLDGSVGGWDGPLKQHCVSIYIDMDCADKCGW